MRVIVAQAPWRRRRRRRRREWRAIHLFSFLFFFLFFFPPLSFSHSLTLELVNSSGESARATQLERGSFRGRDPFFFLTRELR